MGHKLVLLAAVAAGLAVAVGSLSASAARAIAPTTAGASTRGEADCTIYAGAGRTRMVVIIVGATSRQCGGFMSALRGHPFYGHVGWPKRCTMINPSTLAVMGVLTPDASWGRGVCALIQRKGWIR